MDDKLIIIGGGLAGSEAAWQAAQRGIDVVLYEMRPLIMTKAHRTSYLAEIICSNSLGSKLPDRASGILMNELKMMNSLLLACAEKTSVPAGDALAVDREAFSKMVTDHIENHKKIRIVREEIVDIPDGNVIIATGPLTSKRFSDEIMKLVGENHLFFYDAIAPSVYYDSINMNIAFRGARRHNQNENNDYINCPLNEDDYYRFVYALAAAEINELKDFETDIVNGVKAGEGRYFEGCLPVEIIARRSEKALAYGPMRPIGLIDPHTKKKPYAVVQLRQDNLKGTVYNLVGFQTNLKFSEQKRVFRMIPGLEGLEFVRYGQMHRNTYMYSPKHLSPTLQFRSRANLYLAGQIIGVEGYMGNIATGLLAGVNIARQIKGQRAIEMPETTMIGALCQYITNTNRKEFQPMKANIGLLPQISDQKIFGRKQRGLKHYERSKKEIEKIMALIEEEN